MTSSVLSSYAFRAGYAIAYGAIVGFIAGARTAGSKVDGEKAEEPTPPVMRKPNLLQEDEDVVVQGHDIR